MGPHFVARNFFVVVAGKKEKGKKTMKKGQCKKKKKRAILTKVTKVTKRSMNIGFASEG